MVYVWIDALFNYMTALGYCNDKYHDLDRFWPADVHIVGKEIVRFHSIIWPAMLMSLGLPLPKHVFGTGWLLLDGGKMSKSKGNVVDPYLLAQRFGVDALRFFLLRAFPFGTDGIFSNELLIQTINTDLANDLGNLVSRTTAMSGKYFGQHLPADCGPTEDERDLAGMVAQSRGTFGMIGSFPEEDPRKYDVELIALAAGLRDRYEEAMDALAPHKALEEVFKLIQRANKYIDENKPWLLAKDEANKPRLAHVLYNLLECVRISAVLLTPFMPETCEKIFAQIGAEEEQRTWQAAGAWGLLPAGAAVNKGENLFPRIDMEKELKALEELHAQAQAAAQEAEKAPETITIDDFNKVHFVTAKILDCQPVKKSKKLLCFTLDCGEGQAPADPLRHPRVLRARGAHRQDGGGLHQPGPPEDDGPGVQRHAHLRREGGARRVREAPPHHAGRQGARRLRPVLKDRQAEKTPCRARGIPRAGRAQHVKKASHSSRPQARRNEIRFPRGHVPRGKHCSGRKCGISPHKAD